MSPEYQSALLAARRRMGALDLTTARTIQQAVQDWALALARWLASRPQDAARTSQAASREVIYRTAVEMAGKIRRSALTGRDLSFGDTLALWQSAGLRVAERRDLPNALLGAVRRPNLTLLASNRPGAASWQTLLQGHVVNAAGEADAIVRRALLEGISPPELAQRLRKYVVGSETFQSAFRRLETASGESWRISLRDVARETRGQAQQMRANAERIAVTEIHAARQDAERLHFLADPLIDAVTWTLSPDRGANNPPTPPDICNWLAEVDHVGWGSGVLPLDQIPPIPHPRDRCQINPRERKVHQAGDVKPTAERTVDPASHPIPGGGKLTANAADRIRRAAAQLYAFTDAARLAHQAAMQPSAEGQDLASLVRP